MDIAKRWYERARLSRDDYDRFIYAYIVLNYLYAGEGERACAVRFACEKCVVCQFDPFACDVSEYQRSPVVDMLHTDRCYPVTNQRKGLFEAIYQVAPSSVLHSRRRKRHMMKRARRSKG